VKNFYRYLDVDGDGIPQRTLPGVHPKGAYFTRGSGHNKFGGYTEDADEYQEVLDRVARKMQGAAKAVPAPCRARRPRRRRRWASSPSAAAMPPASRRSTR
jgi:2-oxoglutarate/2-oxoacid ferredoxin oxidoreductase subunit alpha